MRGAIAAALCAAMYTQYLYAIGQPRTYGPAFPTTYRLAAAIRGGIDQLAEKPYFTQIVTPLPLYYAKTHSDQIMRAAECGIPA